MRKLGPPVDFPECLLELRRKFQTTDLEKASELLLDAERAYDEVEARVASVQQRAAALQGAVAIAATVAAAGGGLILDRSILDAHGWRIAFAS